MHAEIGTTLIHSGGDRVSEVTAKRSGLSAFGDRLGTIFREQALC